MTNFKAVKIMAKIEGGLMLFFLKILFVMIIVSACQRQPQNGFVYFEDIVFNVDETILSDKIIDDDLNISYKPIKGWQQQPQDIIDLLKDLSSEGIDYTNLRLTLKELFMEVESGKLCFLSYIEYHKMITPEDLIHDYVSLFQDDSDLLHMGSYKHNGIKFHQLTFKNKDTVMTKVIGYHDKSDIFIFQFIIPENLYKDSIRKIESSLGSIKIS